MQAPGAAAGHRMLHRRGLPYAALGEQRWPGGLACGLTHRCCSSLMIFCLFEFRVCHAPPPRTKSIWRVHGHYGGLAIHMVARPGQRASKEPKQTHTLQLGGGTSTSTIYVYCCVLLPEFLQVQGAGQDKGWPWQHCKCKYK